MVDVIRVAKACTSCEYLPIDYKFCKHFVTCFRTFFVDCLVHTVKLKPISYKSTNLRKISNSCISDVATASVHSESLLVDFKFDALYS